MTKELIILALIILLIFQCCPGKKDVIPARQSEALIIKSAEKKQVTAVGTIHKGTVRPIVDTVYLKDSTTEYNFKYNDHWLSLNGTIGKTPVINYLFKDSIILTTYRKNKKLYIDAYSLNPNVQLTGITNLQLANDKQTRFAIGPYVGYGWNGRKWSPSVGVSIQYSFIKF